ncbi:MAG: orotate phosphoribosyltransferase [Chitinispirillaceae bacterium]|nr:orotate phosphoribosyltransferase [Chitinispirillaceae bacterium]
MKQYKQAFIEFMIRSGVLTFGDYVTKSGRHTPFFINTGNYRTGSQIRKLGEFYAAALNSRFGTGFNVLYGPAYKGIPLAVATASALSETYRHDVSFCFNRKEVKDHGEGGLFVGHSPSSGDRIVIIEDVVTAGTSVRESMSHLSRVTGVRVCGLVVSVDRMERGKTEKGALAELAGDYGFDACAIVTLDEIVAHCHEHAIDGTIVLTDHLLYSIHDYRARYGAR